MLKYKFATDSQSGIIEADSWGDAYISNGSSALSTNEKVG